MSDETKKSEGPDLGDWSPDHFPKSPYSVFKKAALLTLLITMLCLTVQWCSMEEESLQRDNKNSTALDSGMEDDKQLDGNVFGDEENEPEMAIP